MCTELLRLVSANSIVDTQKAYKAMVRSMGTILLHPEKLSSRFVPEKLLHRDEQLRALHSLLEQVVRGVSPVPVTPILIGPTGTGKTSSTLLLSHAISREHDITFAYINMRIQGETPFQLFASLYTSLTGVPAPRSLSAAELLGEALAFVKKVRTPAIIVLDEVEFHAKSTLRSAVYALTRLHEVVEPPLHVGVLFIARSTEWLKLLDAAERSSLGNLVVRYPPYSSSQLFDILLYRASGAFRGGTIGEDVIKWLADYTYSYLGSDVRRALETLWMAGVFAEQEGESRVRVKHVVQALRNVEAFIAPADAELLTLHEKLVLYALAMLSNGGPVRLSELREQYNTLAEDYGLEPMEDEEFEDIVQKLVDMGAVLAEGPARVRPTPTLDAEQLKRVLRVSAIGEQE